jgi:putative ATP-dependent endonuclease of OLD family
MARLISLGIKNFRGIKELSLPLSLDQTLFCFIGRGDSGKSTILEAISAVLSPNWNLPFYDTDFYGCSSEDPIEIEVSVVAFNKKLLSEEKYGLHLRSLDTATGELSDEVIEDADDDKLPVLTIRLTVDETLEPRWEVTNARQQENKPIGSADRALLSCFMVSDYLDRHFSWSKGNPLYSLLKNTEDPEAPKEKNVIIETMREAKSKIDEYDFKALEEATNLIKAQASVFGLNIQSAHTTLDFRELSIKDGRVSLHDDAIPFRLKGKGSRRLASLAIQAALVSDGGIMLVDEVEQGLEPDRTKQLVRTLKAKDTGQVFLTTHSRDVVAELAASDLVLIIRDQADAITEARPLPHDDEQLQASLRACSEAFFAKKVIVCEGKTEIGICRSLDKFRKAKQHALMSFMDCAYVLGEGRTLTAHTNSINDAKFKTALFCDSDDPKIDAEKESIKAKGVSIFDCEADLAIEGQVFQDAPWDAIKELINYACQEHFGGDFAALTESVRSKYPPNKQFPANALEIDSVDIRLALAKASTGNREWFKRIDHGEVFGDIIFKYVDQMKDDAHLKKTLLSLSDWIDK